MATATVFNNLILHDSYTVFKHLMSDVADTASQYMLVRFRLHAVFNSLIHRLHLEGDKQCFRTFLTDFEGTYIVRSYVFFISM